MAPESKRPINPLDRAVLIGVAMLFVIIAFCSVVAYLNARDTRELRLECIKAGRPIAECKDAY